MPFGSMAPGGRATRADADRIVRLEAELAEARASLAHAIAIRQSANLSADLVRLAAEELRAPATAVSGYLELLIDGDGGPPGSGQQHMLECAVFHTRRLTDLVDDLVTITQLPSSYRHLTAIELPGIVKARVQRATRFAVSRRVRLVTALAACPDVNGDGATIGRAVDCLLEHAIMFSPPQCAVSCAVRPVADGAAIEVSDHGMSLDSSTLEALLDGRAPANIGDARALLAPRLGLLMVRMIAEAHGGRAEAHADGRQTTLRIVLPPCT